MIKKATWAWLGWHTPLILSLRRDRQIFECKAILVYKSKFQDSQSKTACIQVPEPQASAAAVESTTSTVLKGKKRL